jgi:hypothetical protein
MDSKNIVINYLPRFAADGRPRSATARECDQVNRRKSACDVNGRDRVPSHRCFAAAAEKKALSKE